MADKHTEATCLAFSDIHLNGMKWSITLRQGVTQKDIDTLLDKIIWATEHAAKKGFQFPGAPKAEGKDGKVIPFPGAQKAEKKQEQPTAPLPNGEVGGVDANDNPVRVGGFKVTGTKDKPVVELYSTNEKLKFPVLKPPFSVLESIVHRGYPDVDLSALSDCGRGGEIDWVVSWAPSPKNPKWRDLTAIAIPKLGPPVGLPNRPIGGEGLQE